LRDAATLWGALRSKHGVEARDAVWAHPDLLPSPSDLDDPLGFVQADPPEQEMSDAAFDAALADLLEQPEDESSLPEPPVDEPDDSAEGSR
jgi:hypothetical protein